MLEKTDDEIKSMANRLVKDPLLREVLGQLTDELMGKVMALKRVGEDGKLYDISPEERTYFVHQKRGVDMVIGRINGILNEFEMQEAKKELNQTQ